MEVPVPKMAKIQYDYEYLIVTQTKEAQPQIMGPTVKEQPSWLPSGKLDISEDCSF